MSVEVILKKYAISGFCPPFCFIMPPLDLYQTGQNSPKKSSTRTKIHQSWIWYETKRNLVYFTEQTCLKCQVLGKKSYNLFSKAGLFVTFEKFRLFSSIFNDYLYEQYLVSNDLNFPRQANKVDIEVIKLYQHIWRVWAHQQHYLVQYQ